MSRHVHSIGNTGKHLPRKTDACTNQNHLCYALRIHYNYAFLSNVLCIVSKLHLSLHTLTYAHNQTNPNQHYIKHKRTERVCLFNFQLNTFKLELYVVVVFVRDAYEYMFDVK